MTGIPDPDSAAAERLWGGLRDSAGVSREELPGLAAGILGLARAAEPPPVSPAALGLARRTPFSAWTWQAALDAITGRPDAAGLWPAVVMLAGHGEDPAAAAAALLGMLRACDPPAPRTRLRTRIARRARYWRAWWLLR